MDSLANNVVLGLCGLLLLMWIGDSLRRRFTRPRPQHYDSQDQIAVERQLHESGGPQETAPALKVSAAEQASAELPIAKPPIAEPSVLKIKEQRDEPEPQINWLTRVKQGLGKTRGQLTDNLLQLFAGTKKIDDVLLEEIETLLLTADVGIEATSEIIQNLTDKLQRNQLKDAETLKDALRNDLESMLEPCALPLQTNGHCPFVMLVVGVNGVGKTTTIGKLAKKLQLQGKSVMLAAGDTFRAAAVEQLEVWGERNNVPVVAQHTGADSASVIFDAIQSAKSKKFDVVIADTAGRLQNKENLMAELEKVVRVIKKHDPEAPHEVLLVLDAGTGQNALSQAQLFRQAVGVSGVAVTKLDGTARGGILFAIAKQHQLPIRFIGVGEGIDDLRPFNAAEFVDALFL